MRYFENNILVTRCSAKNDQNVDTQATANLLFWDKNEFVNLHVFIVFTFPSLILGRMRKFKFGAIKGMYLHCLEGLVFV